MRILVIVGLIGVLFGSSLIVGSTILFLTGFDDFEMIKKIYIIGVAFAIPAIVPLAIGTIDRSVDIDE